MMALNANLNTPLAKALDVELLDPEHINIDSCFQETTITIRINGRKQKMPSKDETVPSSDPLFRWCKTIEGLTKLKRETHVREAYTALLSALNQKEFNGKLLTTENATLVVPRPSSRLERPAANEHTSRNIT